MKQILEKLGADPIVRLARCPRSTWDMWHATYNTPAGSIDGFYLHIKQNCRGSAATKQNLQRWSELSNGHGYDAVVVLDNVSNYHNDLSNTQRTFGAKDAKTTKQFISVNFLKKSRWTGLIRREKYFVDPGLSLSDGSKVELAESYLSNWLTQRRPHQDISKVSIGVLVADGGVGKTTISRRLCHKLYGDNPEIVPLLVESKQWQDMLEQGTRKSILTMDKIWENALDLAFSNRFLPRDRTTLQLLVSESIVVVIFDGFDELCVHPELSFNPSDIIKDLANLTISRDDNETKYQPRILLTARRTFWESIKGDIDDREIENVFRIRGFNNDRRKIYFRKRLKDPTDRDFAFRLSRQISGGIYEGVATEGPNEDKPSGVPFILDIIARYAEDHEIHGVQIGPYSTDPFFRLLQDVCSRENQRQNLRINADMQFNIFEELFLAYPNGISIDDLTDVLDVISGVSITPDVVRRFSNHVFLVPSDGTIDRFEARYDVVKIYFLARFISTRLDDARKLESEAERIIRLLAGSSTGRTQLLDFLEVALRELDTRGLLREAIQHALKMIHTYRDTKARIDSGKALFHLVRKVVPSDKDKSIQTHNLVRLMSTSSHSTRRRPIFENVILTDIIGSYDLRNTEFYRCLFSYVHFRNCLFSEKTVFEECTFEGTLEFSGCTGQDSLAHPGETSCTYSHEAEYALSRALGIAVRKEIKEHFAKEVLWQSLVKFKGSNNNDFAKINYQSRMTDFNPGNPYNRVIWRILEDVGIISPHRIQENGEPELYISNDEKIQDAIFHYFETKIVTGCIHTAFVRIVDRNG